MKVFHVERFGREFYVTADGPGHAAVQLLPFLRNHPPEAVNQLEIAPGIFAFGQAARDAYREGIPAIDLNLRGNHVG